MEQLLPDRYAEFGDLCRPETRRSINYETYGVPDYPAGTRLTRGPYQELVFDPLQVGRKFEQQIAIAPTAEGRLDSFLTDLGRVVHGRLLDDEIESAKSLLAAGHVRAAGMAAGVALEGYLKKVVVDRRLTMRKKATRANLNDALREAAAYDVVMWRRLQALAEVRNLCAHKSDRGSATEEVRRLIDEVADVVHTVY